MRRRLMMKQGRLPSEYQEVEWIRGTSTTVGTNYIDLNLNTSVKYSTIKATFNANSTTPHSYDRICGYKSWVNIGLYYSTHGLYIEKANTGYSMDFSFDTIHTIELDDFDIYFDGEFIHTIEEGGGYGENVPLYLMSSGGDRDGTIEIYYFSFSKDGETLREMIPCYRKSDGVIGMYDLCGSICPLTNSPFYINAGTGTFGKGADVQ